MHDDDGDGLASFVYQGSAPGQEDAPTDCEEGCHVGWQIPLQVALKVVCVRPFLTLGIKACYASPQGCG